MNECMYVYVCTVCMNERMFISINVCMYACTYVYECMYVCMEVCIYMYLCICTMYVPYV